MPWKAHADELGPSKVLWMRDPEVALEAMVVVDNVAAGPAIGGVRMAPDVTVEEVARLARAMTLKNAMAGLSHGGAKAGIVADPAMPAEDRARLVRAFGRAIRDLVEYIPGPDMGLDEAAMAVLHDEMGRSVGLPEVLGGIPLDEIGATAWGLTAAAGVVEEVADVEIAGARVAVQGFGAVGMHAARFLVERGAVLVAAADSRGGIADPGGLDVDKLIELKREGRSVAEYPGEQLTGDDIIAVHCDIWIPAARPDVLTEHTIDHLRARVVLQGANIPATAEAERLLHARDVVVVPDFVANAGGVICAAVEYAGGTRTQALDTIADRVARNTREVLEGSRASGRTPREVATDIARSRVVEAMGYRRR